MSSESNSVLSFLALHEQEGALFLPKLWDVGSAKILEQVGFKVLVTIPGGFA